MIISIEQATVALTEELTKQSAVKIAPFIKVALEALIRFKENYTIVDSLPDQETDQLYIKFALEAWEEDDDKELAVYLVRTLQLSKATTLHEVQLRLAFDAEEFDETDNGGLISSHFESIQDWKMAIMETPMYQKVSKASLLYREIGLEHT